MSSTERQKGPFEASPAELRNRIYEYAIPPTGNAVLFLDATNDQISKIDCELPPLALTQTCQLLRDDFWPMYCDYFRRTTFEMHIACYFHPGALEETLRWLHNIGPTARRLMGSIRVCVAAPHNTYPSHQFFFAAYEEAMRSIRSRAFHLLWSAITQAECFALFMSGSYGTELYRVLIVEGPDPRNARQRRQESGFDDFGLGLEYMHGHMKGA